MKERIVFKAGEQDLTLAFGGKRYRLLKEIGKKGVDRRDAIFEEIDEKEISDKIEKIADYLVSASKIDAKTIVAEVLSRLSTDTLNRIGNQVERGEPVETVPGCIKLKIGRRSIEIVE